MEIATTETAVVYSVSSSQAHAPWHGPIFNTSAELLAYVAQYRVGSRVALWGRRVTEVGWFKLGLLCRTRRGVRVIPTHEGETNPDWVRAYDHHPDAVDHRPPPARLSPWGQVLRIPTLDYPSRYDDPEER
jgi:hypothetical protein